VSSWPAICRGVSAGAEVGDGVGARDLVSAAWAGGAGDVAHKAAVTSLVQPMVDAEIDGVRRRYHVIRCGPDHFVDSALGSTALREVERFPDPSAIQEAGSLLAPMPGSVVRVEVTEGQQVTAGATVLVLEAMKMEHTVRAPADGIVASIQVAAGEQVDSGQVLAVVHDEQTADA